MKVVAGDVDMAALDRLDADIGFLEGIVERDGVREDQVLAAGLSTVGGQWAAALDVASWIVWSARLVELISWRDNRYIPHTIFEALVFLTCLLHDWRVCLDV